MALPTQVRPQDLVDPQGSVLDAEARLAIRRIAVFRALQLGDLLCATPALRALRVGFPKAEIVLVGLAWSRTLAERLDTIDRVQHFPGHPGLPEVEPDLAAYPSFLHRMQTEHFDLAIQMHGSGQLSNPLVACFGATRQAGFRVAGAWFPDGALGCDWPEHGHEIERCLTLTDSLGCPRQGLHLDFPLAVSERARARIRTEGGDWACVHPGARLPSRRWPADRFAQVAGGLAERGLKVAITGAAGEAALCAAVHGQMRHPGVNLCGQTTLWELGALLEQSKLLVSNDTGVSHVAAAVGTRSVVVCSGADPQRWAPLDARRHRVLAHPVPCRPCAYTTCPIDHPCATGVTVEHCLAAVDEQRELEER